MRGDSKILKDKFRQTDVTTAMHNGSYTLPSPTEVIRGTLQLFIEYDLASSIWILAKRIGFAFLLASAVAVPLGVLLMTFIVGAIVFSAFKLRF